MPWKPITIDESITRFGQGGTLHVEEGDYLFELSRIEPSPEDREGDPFFSFHFKIQEGPDGLGKSLRYTAMLTAAKPDGTGGAWGLGRVLNALGADPAPLVGTSFPTYQKFAQFAAALGSKLGGTRVGGEVSDDTRTVRGQTQIVSNITGFFPSDEWDLRSKPRTETAAPKTPKAAAKPANGTAAPAPAPAEDPAGDLDDEISKLFGAPAAAGSR